MATSIAERIPIIDTDSHVSEPADLWTSRVSRKWGDLVPHVVKDPRGPRADGKTDDVWIFGGEVAGAMGGPAMAGFDGFLPDHPATLSEAHPGAYDAAARVRYMDDVGLRAQVIYPNVGGFGSGRFLKLKEPELMLDCVRAYNDFLADWTSVAPERFIPIMALPFWDVPAAIVEMDRAQKRGLKGIVFGSQPETWGQAMLPDPHWDPIWAAAQDRSLSVNFHIISGNGFDLFGGYPGNGQHTNAAKQSAGFFLDNSNAIGDVIMGGICDRFPRLKFVSVESGIGWIPSYLEALDWQWRNMGAYTEHPERELLPSEYFRRQVYGCFWFERTSAFRVLDLYPDNWLFETDFPHPTSLSDGPKSSSGKPRDWVDEHMATWPEELLRKVLHDNAAAVYGVE